MDKYCPNCGAMTFEDKAFCADCGFRLNRQPQPDRPAQPPQRYRQMPPEQPSRQYRQSLSELQSQQQRQVSPEQQQRRRASPEQQRQRASLEQQSQQQQTPFDQQSQQQQQQTPFDRQSRQQQQMPFDRQSRQQRQAPPEVAPQRKRGRKRVVALIVILVIIAGAAGAYFYYRSALDTPPDVRANPRGSDRIKASGFKIGQVVGGGARDTDKYTFLVLGADYGEYNTDVIMAVTFDTSSHTLDIVNIPRDTLVNVSWNLKKANSILANMRSGNSGKPDSEAKSMQATVEAFADILGYEVDYWVLVNIKAFVSLIDAIGGVDFDVPVNMNYDDTAAGLSIHYSKGTHHLSGQQAIEVMRFRSGYSNADIGRIGTQQGFLKSAAEQILEKRSSLSVVKLAGIFLNNIKTDMKLDDLIWFGKEFIKMEAENISFHTIPANTTDSVGSQSYVTIRVDEWLELLNSTLSPFGAAMKASDVSILTRGSDKRLYVTDGNRRGSSSWGS